jgi:hypothetical protein
MINWSPRCRGWGLLDQRRLMRLLKKLTPGDLAKH